MPLFYRVILCTDSGAGVGHFSMPTERETVAFGWMKSNVRDWRIHLLTAITKVGAYMTAIMTKMSQSSAILSRPLHLQMVGLVYSIAD